jgi:asparaginyl-tRNA synthetase
MESTLDRIGAPRSWLEPRTHFLKAMRSPWYRLLLALQDTLTSSTTAFWTKRGARFGHLPITTGSVSSPMGLGSDSSPVEVSMFGVPTYLADSMQFGLEYLCRLNDRGAYYLMPSFRGEAADATHLCQFFHSEAEVPGGLDDVLVVVEEYLRHIVGGIVAEHTDVLSQRLGGVPEHALRMLAESKPFLRVTFDDAAGILGDDPRLVRHEANWRGLTRAGETELMRRLGQFVWVTHWDQLAVPFYQAVDGQGKALNADLLFGPGEVVGCGERHATGEAVLEALRVHEVPEDGYEWYVQLKSEAPMRTAGFGLGVERLFMWLLDHDDIRDLALFPRENGRTILP